MKKTILVLSLVVLVVLCLAALNFRIPFGLEDMKYVESYHLRNSVKELQLRAKPELYGYTNKVEAIYLYRTNIVLGSNVYSSIMRLDSPNFRKKGYLLATENQSVFWVGVDGGVEELKVKKEP